MSGTATSTQTSEDILKDACARNVSAELQYEDNQGILVTARVRLFQISGNHILADTPQYSNGQGRIPPGRPIRVYLVIGSGRHQFESTIEETRVRFALNEQQNIQGIALRKPEVVTEAQRRANFRLHLLGTRSIEITLVRPHKTIANACNIDAGVTTGWILDISAGGVAALVEKERPPPVQCRFYLSFALPGHEDTFQMLGSVRHVEPVKRTASLRIGFAFLPWLGCDLRGEQRRLYRFLANQQRHLLRRKK